MFQNIKLDLKTIAIIILGGALVLSIIFRRSKPIDMYENEIEALHNANEVLLSENDSLSLANMVLDEEIDRIYIVIEATEARLDSTNIKIKDLEDGKNKITTHVAALDADGISKSLTEYLNRR